MGRMENNNSISYIQNSISKFVEDCMSLYEAFTSGTVKMSEMVALIEEYAGIKLVHDEQFSMFAEKVGEQ